MAGVRYLIVCLVDESLLAVVSVVAVVSAVAVVSVVAVVSAVAVVAVVSAVAVASVVAVAVAVAVGSLLQVQLLSSLPLPTCPGTGTLEHPYLKNQITSWKIDMDTTNHVLKVEAD